MPKDFVAKKTITVQLTLELLKQFEELCEVWNLPKTKAIEKLISEAYVNLYDGG